MYNFMANWPRLEELLTFEPIADLRDDEMKMKWNDRRQNERDKPLSRFLSMKWNDRSQKERE